MSIVTLDHVNIRTPDLEPTKDFFTEILGLKAGARPSFPNRGYWLYAGGTPIVHLSEGDAESRGGTGSFGHVAFRATGLAQMRRTLTEHGVPFTEQVVPGRGEVQLFVREPSGVTVELQFSGTEAG